MSKSSQAKSSAALTLVTEPDAYFHELVRDVMGQQRVATQPEAEFYLVKLLTQFLNSDRLYIRDGDGHTKDEPIALMLKEALETPQPEQQRMMFRQVGDVSLYTAGYFQDSLSRKLVDVDYYVQMGGKAYELVAERTDDHLRKLYGELAEKFAAFVDVLAEISARTTPKTEKDLLRLYEFWQRTGSERAAKILQEAGIVPQNSKKNVQ